MIRPIQTSPPPAKEPVSAYFDGACDHVVNHLAFTQKNRFRPTSMGHAIMW